MKVIVFSQHALDQLRDRGTSEAEVKKAIYEGEERCCVKIKYDPKVDAAYISFKEGHVDVTTLRLTEDIAVDFGPGEEIVGIEILDASNHLELSPRHPEVKLENLIAG